MSDDVVEKPLRFGRSNALVGVLASPADAAADAPSIVFINAGIIHRVGPNRLYVNLARSLARRGVSSLRFDLAGIGDSGHSREERGSVMDVVERDLCDALDVATRENPERGVVLVGLCSGADNALETAVRDARVVGAILLDPNAYRTRWFWAHHYARALLRPKTWKNLLTGGAARRLARAMQAERAADSGMNSDPEMFLAPSELPPREVMDERLRGLLGRGCRLFFVFTGGLPARYNHEKQLARTFPGLLYERGVRYRYHPDWDHTFSHPAAQTSLADAIGSWLLESDAGRAQKRPG